MAKNFFLFIIDNNTFFFFNPEYYIEKNLMDCVRQTLNQLTKPINFNSIDFKPSLTPQRSHLETIKIVSLSIIYSNILSNLFYLLNSYIYISKSF